MNNNYKINIKSDWFNYISEKKNINYNIDIYVDNINYEENENKIIITNSSNNEIEIIINFI